MDKVSVIVAAYNVEKYIDRCVKSLIEQTYKNIEIIIVDDGSVDDTSKLCDSYCSLDNRIICLHKKNGGLSSARNYGIKHSKAPFIAFVDGDDWVEKDFIETLYYNIKKENADLSTVGYRMVWDNGKTKCNTPQNEYRVFDQDTALHELFSQEKMGCMAWQRMYKRDIFNEILFPEGKLFEDVAIALEVMLRCNKVVWTGDFKYNYYQRSGSIVNSNFNLDKLYMLECCQKMIEFSNSKEGRFDKETNAFYLKSAMMLMMQAYGSIKSNETSKAKRIIRNGIIEHQNYIWGNPYLSKIRQFILMLMRNKYVPERVLYKLWKINMEK